MDIPERPFDLRRLVDEIESSNTKVEEARWDDNGGAPYEPPRAPDETLAYKALKLKADVDEFVTHNSFTPEEYAAAVARARKQHERDRTIASFIIVGVFVIVLAYVFGREALDFIHGW